MCINSIEEHLNPLKERLSSLEKEIENLAMKVDAFYAALEKSRKEQNAFMREEWNKILDGTEKNPGILKQLKKLEKLDDIVRILDERLPKPKE